MTARRDERRPGRPWVIDISYVDSRTGQRRRYYRNAKKQYQEGARQEDRRLGGQLDELGYIPDDGDAPASIEAEAKPELTFADAVREVYEEGGLRARLKPSSQRGYDKNLRTHLLDRFGKLRLSEIDRAKVMAFDLELAKRKLTASTRNNIIIPLRSIIRGAVDLGLHEKLPEFPRLARVKSKVFEPPPPELVDRIVEVTPLPGKAAVAVLAYAGLRAGEVRGLRWQDVNLDTGVLYVRRAFTKNEVSTPKSGHERAIPIAPALMTVLQAAAKAKPKPTAPVAPPSKLDPLLPCTEDQLRKLVLRAVKAAGGPHMRLHDLRHFFVSRCFEGGASAPTVQKLAGHLHLSVTQRYAHTNDAAMREAVGVFGRKAS
jgi:integrase